MNYQNDQKKTFRKLAAALLVIILIALPYAIIGIYRHAIWEAFGESLPDFSWRQSYQAVTQSSKPDKVDQYTEEIYQAGQAAADSKWHNEARYQALQKYETELEVEKKSLVDQQVSLAAAPAKK